MKYLVDFVNQKTVKKSKIYTHLKCDEANAKILQHLTQKYLDGFEDVMVSEMLQDLFETEKTLDKDVLEYKFLNHLEDVKGTLELGWITQQSFTPLKINDLSNLELLNTAVALAPSFLRLLEEGPIEVKLPDVKPYEDHLEYLQDQFYRIELYQKMSAIRQNVHEHSLGIDRIYKKIELLESRIEERVVQTDQNIVLDKFFKQKKLDSKEQVIFLALLKEEYNASEGTLREMNALIDLISHDEYERIKNRSLLEDGATLLSEDIMDYEEMLNPFGGITRAFYIVDDVLQSIMHPQKKKRVRRLKLNMLIKEQELFELVEPNTALDDVVLNESTKKTLLNLMQQMDKEVVSRLISWGIKDKKSGLDARIIFYGPPGTGKTMTAYSLAKSLKRQILNFDCSKILSMYVGESEKNVRKVFDTYSDLARQTKTEPILLLNEADQFLSARSSGGGGGSADQMHNQMQNIFLEQIEKFEGILIATTNLLENIDTAFSRRFNYKIEFKKPTLEQRIELWEKMLPKEAPFEKNFSIKNLAEHPLSGGQINLVIKNAAYSVATQEKPLFTEEVFLKEIKKERAGNFDSEKSMGFLNT
jgi:AAA+ superfamily predicted ATPase